MTDPINYTRKLTLKDNFDTLYLNFIIVRYDTVVSSY
jgi:hypothetical protein